jgi:hypothetical protein
MWYYFKIENSPLHELFREDGFLLYKEKTVTGDGLWRTANKLG